LSPVGGLPILLMDAASQFIMIREPALVPASMIDEPGDAMAQVGMNGSGAN